MGIQNAAGKDIQVSFIIFLSRSPQRHMELWNDVIVVS